MLNQSYTADNFETIYDIENREKSIIEYLGEDYKDTITDIKVLQDENSQIKRKRINERSEIEKQNLINNNQRIDELKEKKKEIRHNELEKISQSIKSKNFKFDLQSSDNEIFKIQDTKEAFFAIKQLQYNIRKTFKVKQSSRHLILSQIKLLLNDSSPKYVIRTDVSRFFETIPQDRVFRIINNNTLLNTQSKNFIKHIIEDYNGKKDTTKIGEDQGIPRGVGISSYLSEIFMKDIDNRIKNMSDVVYYARYVDDIFIIISPKLPKRAIKNYFAEVKEIAEREQLSLKDIGDAKCTLLDLTNSNVREENINYLGYCLNIKRVGNITSTLFGLSEQKIEKIKNRITTCFDNFNNTNKYDIKKAKKEFFLCLRFLCSNTKLSGAKSRIKTGIYYSNYLLDEKYYTNISELDDFVREKSITPHSLLFANEQACQDYAEKLKGYITNNFSFMKGFSERTYYSFSRDELKIIKKILK
jgi:hypothetical protein